MQLLNEGAIYINGRDNKHRPICYYNVSVIKDYPQEKLDAMADAVSHMLTFVYKHLLVPGRVE